MRNFAVNYNSRASWGRLTDVGQPTRPALQGYFRSKPSWALAHHRIMKMLLPLIFTDFSQDFYSVCVNPCNLWFIFRTKEAVAQILSPKLM